jgi:GH15 family glucan-1,4-alpha-glucosidase
MRKVWKYNMSRPVFLGNGQLTVGLDEFGLVHDFYYPYVGLENLSTARSIGHKIGIWVDSKFSWVDKTWECKVDFYSDALISNISLTNRDLQIELYVQDFVDFKKNIFFRKIKVINLANNPRTVRLFMHQMFEISHQGRADTAFFVPEENYILDYKGKSNLLIYGQKSDGKPFESFAVGSYGIEGKQGTFIDAEDGVLSDNLVEHGSVDSVIGFSLSLNAKGSDYVDYWIIASDTQFNAEKIHNLVKLDSLDKHLEDTRDLWHDWFKSADSKLSKIATTSNCFS